MMHVSDPTGTEAKTPIAMSLPEINLLAEWNHIATF